MSNPTSNFNWQMPTSSDLVTDLPADFEVFGQAVDTSLADLKGGTTGQILSKATNADMDFTWVAPTTGDITGVTAGTGISGGGTSGDVTITNSMATAMTTKGDLIVATGSGTFQRQGVGANGTVLMADSAEADGVKWATPSSGTLSWALRATLSGSGASSLTASGLSSKAYLIIFQGLSSAAYSDFDITFNSDTGNNYGFLYARQYGAASYSTSVFTSTGSVSDPRIRTGSTSATQTSTMNGGLTIREADTTGLKPFISNFGINAQGGADGMSQSGQGFYAGTSAITSITITSTGGNFDGGTVYIYGGN